MTTNEKPIADDESHSELDPFLDTFDDDLCDECGELIENCICDTDDDDEEEE
jgi:hypothetical protein